MNIAADNLYARKFLFHVCFFPAPTLTAIEVWLICCIFFILIALIEFGIVLYMVKNKRKLKEREGRKHKLTVQAWSNQKDLKICEPTTQSEVIEKVDGFCLVVLPFLFAIFNIIYWSIYLK